MTDLHIEAILNSTDEPVAEGDLIWKEALFEGSFTHPQDKTRKFHVTREPGKTDPVTGTISIPDLLAAHEAQAYDHVQVPLAEKAGADHEDYARVNTGFVKKLRTRTRPDGREAVDVGILFTEPEVKGKCERGTINNGSSGIFFNVEKDDGRRFPVAMRHYALTNTNWLSGQDPFVKLSDDDPDAGVDTYTVTLSEGETVWSPKDSFDTLREWVQGALSQLTAAQNPLGIPTPDDKAFYLRDLAPTKALVQQEPDNQTLVVPFKRKKDGVELAPQDEWTVAQQEWVAASDDTIFSRARTLALSATEGGGDEQGTERTDPTPTPETPEESVEASGAEAETAPEAPAGPAPTSETLVRAIAASLQEQRPTTPEGRLRAAQEERKSFLASNNNNGGAGMSVARATNPLEGLNLSDEHRSAVEAILASHAEREEQLQSENETLRRSTREVEADARIEELKALGLSAPGFLKQYRAIMLADDGQPAAILMSDDGRGTKVELSATQIADALIDALPRVDDKIVLSEQQLAVEEGVKPNTETEEEGRTDAEDVAVLSRVLRIPLKTPEGVTS